MIINIYIKKIVVAGLIASAAFAAACSGQKMGSGGNATASAGIQGAGSTFVKPMMDKWTSEYGKLHPDVKIDYQGGGSGAGIKAIQNLTSDFGASDAAMTDDELKQASAGELVHIPVVLGAVVLTYNLEELKKPLRLTPELISDIYLGKIKKWNDAQIKRENPDAALPDAEITPVFRADGSGTSDVFTDFLSKTVPEWKEKIGRTKNPQLPQGVGIGGKGNEGVMGQVKNTPNTIGYVELTFAKANNLPAAFIKNKSGIFIEPTSDSVTAAAAGMASQVPDDLRTEITNADGENAYPISGIVFVLAYKEQKDAAKGKILADYLWWALHDGEKYVKDLHYAPVPAEIVRKAEVKINSLSFGGKALRSGN
ncbi:MAG TPA: phosphate ABC transporter substrate-binding protein PstS [Blastocatellia bacterium]|nr:phosphate ABC transporter substrate-binding protein PstS [Blastocatellia bacterium]